jgi:hypothetical protein
MTQFNQTGRKVIIKIIKENIYAYYILRNNQIQQFFFEKIMHIGTENYTKSTTLL